MNSDKTVVERSSDDMIDALGKWGGAMAFFIAAGSFICTRFGEYNLFIIMAQELFEEKVVHEKRLRRTQNDAYPGHFDLKIPNKYIFAKCLVDCCWCFSCNKNKCRNQVFGK